MGSAAAPAGARRAADARVRPAPRPLATGELAWIAALPCALATTVAVLLLGPPLGHAFLRPGSEAFWPSIVPRPEPVEHARYLIALVAPLLLAGILPALAGRRIGLEPRRARILVSGVQALLLALVVLCLLAQHDILARASVPPVIGNRIFTWRTLLAAALLVAGAIVVLRRLGSPARLARLAAETRARRLACAALAAGATALWLLTAVNSDGTAGFAPGSNLIPWDLSETFAVLDGRTPLVDFHAQYAQLLPFLAAAILALTQATLLAWTILMASLSGGALLAVYGVVRRIARSSTLALALYLPFLATSFFVLGPTRSHFSPAEIFSLWPMRYGGPYVLAWLTARQLDGAAPRRVTPLCVAGALVALNNPEFGIGAFLGMLAALALRPFARSWKALALLSARAAIGLLTAAALVSLLTLARAGVLPDFGLVLEFPRLYGIGGWQLSRMEPLGLHLAVYATFAAATVVAAVRATRRDEQPALTGMLAWSGVFGLFAGSYYVGSSYPLNLMALLSIWSLTLALLTVPVVRGLATRGWRRPAVAELLVLFGFGLAVCSLVQVPTPWGQAARLGRVASIPVFERPEAAAFVARLTRPGQDVVILIPLGHRIAYDLHRTDISPYASIEAMPTRQQLDTVVATARKAHVRQLFLSTGSAHSDVLSALQQAGFVARHQDGPYLEFVDTQAGGR